MKTLLSNTLIAVRITSDKKILTKDNHAKKMNELEKRLEAISNQSNL